ncbi:MAG TPA: hypothetical protein VN365_02570 [Candidatus Thermoplasmatota archaeon]|nr:hypothetical protein [Candidatus Thermoplasmatota archaeon]
MRKKILIGSLVAAVLILSVPMASAVEWKTVETKISELNIQDPSLQTILKKDKKDPQPSTIILFLTALILFLKFVRYIRQNFKLSQIILGLIILIIVNYIS